MRTIEGESLETHKRALSAAADLVDLLRDGKAGKLEGGVEWKYKTSAFQQYGIDVHTTINTVIDGQDVEIEFQGIRRSAQGLSDYSRALVRYKVSVKVHKYQHYPIIQEKAGKLDLQKIINAVVGEVAESKQKHHAIDEARKLATKSQAVIDSLKTAVEQAGAKIGNRFVSISQTKMRDTPFTLELRHLTEQQLRSVLATLIERHPS